ncbi:MAG: SatD family protein [Ginsengibacter sp.]
MVCVITGDIINSKHHDPIIWMKALKRELNKAGISPMDWEIYRGDSFQLILKNPSDALLYAIAIKSALKSIKKLDVRMAIGIGVATFSAEKIKESNGSAFVNSGEKFELLKQEKLNLAVKSDWPDFDREMNLYLKLSLIAMDNWTVNAAKTIQVAIENREKSQVELGELLGINQSAVSSRLKRAYYEEVMEVNAMFQSKLNALK